MTGDHGQVSAIARDSHRISEAVESVMDGVVARIQHAVDAVPIDPEWEEEVRVDARDRTFGPSAEEIISHRHERTTSLEALQYIEEWFLNEQYRQESH